LYDHRVSWYNDWIYVGFLVVDTEPS
jgi:hypothetical protein